MSYVIRRTDQGGGFVSIPELGNGFTTLLQEARIYPTRRAAEMDLCVENEQVEEFWEALNRERAARIARKR